MKKHPLNVQRGKRLVTQKLFILVVEDNNNDYQLVLAELRRAEIEFESTRVQTKDEFTRQLKERKPDLVISDYMLPKFTGLEALHLVQKFDPFTPVIICTGSINEETAVECIKAGAADYVLKEQMSRFGSAVRGALELARQRIENDRNQRELLKLSSAVQQAADSIVITDVNGVIEFVNPTFERTTGYTREEVLGKTPRILKSGYHPEKFYKHLWATILDGKTFYAEFLNRKKDGTEYYQEEKITPILNERGRITHFVSTGRDVTLRKKAQEALRQSEERYRQVVESASEIIFTTDIEGRFTNANRAALRITGFTLDELRQHKYLDLILPEHRQRVTRTYRRQLLGREPASYIEYPFRSKSGEIKWFGQTGSLLVIDDKVTGFSLIARDITARKKAEEMLRASEERFSKIFSASPIGIAITTMSDGRFLDANPAFLKIYEYSREAVIGRTSIELNMWPSPLIRENMVTRVRHDGSVSELEVEVRTKSGKDRVLMFSAEIVEIAGEQCLLALQRDVTEQKRAQTDLADLLAYNKTIIEQSPIGIITYRATGEVVSANQAVIRMIGATREALMKQNFRKVKSWGQSGLRDKAEEVLSSGKEQEFETHMTTTFGKELWLSCRFVPFLHEGQQQLLAHFIDITQRKNAQRAIEESEKKYRDLVDTMNEGLGVQDKDGMITFMNKRALEMLGYTEHELLGKSIYTLFKGEDRSTIEQQMKKRRNGIRQSFEVAWTRKDGTKIDTIVAPSPVFDEQGNLTGSVAVFTDITDRKRSEQELRRSEELFRTLASTSPIGIFVYQGDRFVYANERTQALLGYSLDELGRMNLLDVVHPDFRDFVLERAQARQRGEDVPDRYELKIVRKDGKETWIGYAGGRIDWNGKAGVLGTVFDITELKKAERELKEHAESFTSLFNSSTEGFIIHEDGVIVDVNDRLLAMSGYSRESLLGQNLLRIVAPESRATVVEMVNSEFEKPAEIMGQKSDGRRLPVEILTRGIRHRGRDARLTGVRDISDRKAAEQAVRHSEERLRLVWERSGEGMRLTERGGHIVSVNEAYCKLMQKSRENLLGQLFSIVYKGARPEDSVAEYKRRFESGNITPRLSTNVILWNNEKLDLDIVNSFIESASGEKLVLSIFHDTTEQRKAETSLRDSEERFRALFEFAPDAYYLHSLEGTFIDGNKAAERLTGYSRRELIGKNFFNLDLLSNDQMGRAAGLLKRNHEGHPTGPDEFTLKKKSGQIIPIEVSTHPLTIGNERLVLGIARDVTERMKAEERIREQAALLDITRDAVVVRDTSDMILYWNKGAERLYGWVAAEAVGRTVFEVLYDGEEGQKAYERAKHIALQSGEWEGELSHRSRSGRKIVVQSRWTLMPGRGGDARSILVVNTDVTDKKGAELALRESEERFRSIYESSPVGIVSVSPEGRFVRANFSFQHIVGYTEEELLEIPFNEVTVEEDRAIGARELRELVEGRRDHAEFEKRYLHKNGNAIWVHLTVACVRDMAGNLLYTVTMVEDITERRIAESAMRESEERFRTIYEKSPLGIALVDAQGKYLGVNKALQRILGYSEQELLRKSFRDVTLPDDRELGHAELMELDKGLREYVELEKRYVHKSGRIVWGHLIVSAVRDKIGKVLYTVGIIEDISDRKSALERQRMLEAQLTQAQKMEAIGTLAGGIAHDFNNILGIILGHATLIGHTKGEPDVLKNSIDTISKAVQRGAGIVRQVLTFARRTDTERMPVNVNKLVEEMSKMLREMFPKTIELTVQSSSQAPIITVDQTQFQQALMNLCINARDAMTASDGTELGAGTLTIRVEKLPGKKVGEKYPEATASEYVCITVADTGAGMDEATRQKIFEPFFTTKPVGKGTGLGLAVVYGVVTSHGGFIDVSSTVSKGTTFALYFPSSASYSTDIPESPRLESERLKGSETVLVVEDEDGLLDLIAGSLKRHGYRVLTAKDGLEALEQFDRNNGSVAVVVTDVGLPKLDGKGLFTALKLKNPSAKVILASGYLEPGYKSELLKAGAVDFIQKPYQLDEVLNKIRDVLDEK